MRNKHSSACKETACNAGDPGSIPWLGRSPGKGNSNELQYACLENSTDRGAWQATVHGVPNSQTQLSNFHLSLSQHNTSFSSVQFNSVAQSCPTLRDPMNRSTPGLPVHHKLPEFTQTHVHRISDAIQPSHPLSSPSPPAPILPSIRVFSNELTLHTRWSMY